MFNSHKVIGLIPARGGSKGIPKKNIRNLLGKPLIAWTIEEALKSKYIDRVVVSTDDEEIAQISKKYGAEIPFMRPKYLAQDSSRSIDVILHAIKFFEERYGEFILVYLQPTSPLRLSKDIDNAIKLLEKLNAKAIVSVCECEFNPLLANVLPEDRCLNNFLKEEIINKNRQELPIYYRLNGAIFLGYSDYIKELKSFFGKETYAYIMPIERSIDINTLNDFIVAECLLRKNFKSLM